MRYGIKSKQCRKCGRYRQAKIHRVEFPEATEAGLRRAAKRGEASLLRYFETHSVAVLWDALPTLKLIVR